MVNDSVSSGACWRASGTRSSPLPHGRQDGGRRASGALMLAAACCILVLCSRPAQARPFSDAETWAITALSQGAARLSEREGCGRLDERAEPTLADSCRTIGADALRAALLAPSGVGAAEDRRLILSDAVIEGELDLSGAEIDKALTFERVRFTGPVRMRGTVLRGEVSMSHVAFADAWSARSLRLSRALTISDAAFDGDVDGRELVSDDLVRVDRTTFGMDLRLARMKARSGLLLFDTTVKGDVQFEQSEPGFAFVIAGSTFEGSFNAATMRGNLVGFEDARFRKDLILLGASAQTVSIKKAEIEGSLESANASIMASLRIEQTQVSGGVVIAGLDASSISLLGLRAPAVQALNSRSKFFEMDDVEANNFDLSGSIFGIVGVRNSRFAGTVRANSISGSSFGLRDSRVEGDVLIRSASLTGSLIMSGTVIRGELNLVGASCDGNIEIVGEADKRVSTGRLIAVGIRTGRNTDLSFLDVAGNLWISGQVAALSLGDVKVAKQLQLNSLDANQEIRLLSVQAGDIRLANVAARDAVLEGATSAGRLTIYRSRIANSTTIEQVRAPSILLMRLATTDLSLDRLAVESLVIMNSSAEDILDARALGTRSWALQHVTASRIRIDVSDDAALKFEDLHWKSILVPCAEAARIATDELSDEVKARCLRRVLDRNELKGAQPYAQAASVYADAGQTAIADDFRFRGRQRQSTSFPEHAVEAVIGYGIGTYAYRVFAWILGLSVVAAAVLYGTVPAARAKGPVWCFGAGLNQLLPVVTLNKEFADFFNDPDRQRLRGWQIAFFAVIATIGWVLGLFVVAGMTGLTQKI